MRVDDVPTWLKPAFHAYGYGAWAITQAAISTIRRACVIDREQVAKDDGAPRIECIWHEHLPSYIATYLPPQHGRRVVWMNHPIWFMRPIHVLLMRNGVEELILGSTGNGGQRALDELTERMREGCSTGLAVDGPNGPVHVLKRGALDLSRASKRPIVAISFEYERAVRLPGWDRKWAPRPGSKIRIRESAPLYVTDENYESSRATITAAL